MECAVCGEHVDIDPADDLGEAVAICAECSALGFAFGPFGSVMCPECGGDFKRCGCSAPDSAYL